MNNPDENITPGPFWVWVFIYNNERLGEVHINGQPNYIDLSGYPELEDQQMYKIFIENSKIVKAEKRIVPTPTKEEIKKVWDDIQELTKDGKYERS